MAQNPSLAAYRTAWDKAFSNTLLYSPKLSTKNITHYDILNRFWTIPEKEKPLPLLLVSHVSWLTKEDLQSFVEEADQWRTTKQHTFTFQDAGSGVNENAYAQISTHPLGFYSTWATLESLDRLVVLQNNNTSWIRPVPDQKQFDQLNTSLMNQAYTGKNTFLQVNFKYYAVTENVVSKYDLRAGEPVPWAARIGTKRFMGHSANKASSYQVSFLFLVITFSYF